MTETNTYETASVEVLPPPPYPPPLPVQVDLYSPSDNTINKRPMFLIKYKKTFVHKYNQLMERTPDIVKYFEQKIKWFLERIQKLPQLSEKILYQTKGNLKKFSKDPSSLPIPTEKLNQTAQQLSIYLKQETPVHQTFINIGRAVLILSLLSAPFLSPSIWVTTSLAGVLQMIVGVLLRRIT